MFSTTFNNWKEDFFFFWSGNHNCIYALATLKRDVTRFLSTIFLLSIFSNVLVPQLKVYIKMETFIIEYGFIHEILFVSFTYLLTRNELHFISCKKFLTQS